VVVVGQGLLHPEREEHYPRDHRQVEVRVGIAGHSRARVALRLRERPAGHQRDHVEVGPPHRRRDRHPEDAAQDDPGVELREALGARAQRDYRLPERDDDDQRVALGPVLRPDVPALAAAAEQHAAVVHHQRKAEEAELKGVVGHEGGRDDDQRADDDRRRQPLDRPSQQRVLA
jgi:hypothetical protein